MGQHGSTLEHPVFGTMTQERHGGWRAYAWLTPKHRLDVVVEFDADEDTPLRQILDQAAAILQRIRQEEWSYRLSVTDRQLYNYNEGWRQEEDPVLDRETFSHK